MKNQVVLIGASPKTKQERSVSEYLLSLCENRIDEKDFSLSRINVRQCLLESKTEQAFTKMTAADAIVFSFPLYIFCLPGMLMRFLEDYHQYYLSQKENAKSNKIYAIVNCGFPESYINEEAVRVIKSFSQKINSEFRFGLLVGGGGMLLGAQNAPIMKKTNAELNQVFDTIKNDIINDYRQPMENMEIAMNFPPKLYLFMGNIGWNKQAKDNGLSKKDLFRQPYIK